MKEPRREIRPQGMRWVGQPDLPEPAAVVVRGTHPALERAMARAAGRGSAQLRHRALCAAQHPTLGAPAPPTIEGPASAGTRVERAAVLRGELGAGGGTEIFVATLRTIPLGDRWYRVRTWRRIAMLADN